LKDATSLAPHVAAIAGDITVASHGDELAVLARGHGGLDAVINNAGALGPSPQPELLYYPLDVLSAVFEANVVAPLGVLQAVRDDLKPLEISQPEGVSFTLDGNALRWQKWSLRVGFNHRFHPALRKAHELVEAGAYGPVQHLRGRYGHGGRIGYEREWRADRARSGGGELLDQGIHLIDLTRYLVGDVALAFCELRTEFWPMEVEDNAYVALRAEQGAFAWLHASWSEWKNLFSLEISMRDAKIEITGLGGSYGIERLTLHEMKPEMGPPDTTAWEWPLEDESWHAEIDDVLAALAGQPTIGASLDDCVAAFAIVDEAYRHLPGEPAPRTRR